MGFAVRVEIVSKAYRIDRAGIGGYKTLREELVGLAARPFRRLRGSGGPARETFWALRDVSFEVTPGQVVGVIGRNGAGKSTLLKVLGRITRPSSGLVRTRGRVGSLLEVGTGFHPELTGRENIYLNGSILGMGRAEIRRRFDEIVAFAEVERFLDTPVKRYSSGMYVRLAFAVAAHLEPEILLVDEVLAVGDGAFQKKCLGKMGDAARAGRTLVFVSHSMAAVQALCRRVIHLDAGRVVGDGEAKAVIAGYSRQGLGAVTERVWDDPRTAPCGGEVRVRAVRVRPDDPTAGPLTVESPFRIEVEFENAEEGSVLNLSAHLLTADDVRVLMTFSRPRPLPRGRVRATCRLPGDLLNDGLYRLSVYVARNQSVLLAELPDVLAFEVCDVERDGTWLDKWHGVVRPRLDWEVSRVPAGAHSATLNPLRAHE